jgi:hypothetical protein
VKLVAFLCASFVLLLAVVAWPALRTDWRWWQAKRHYQRLHVGDSKTRVRHVFGKPPFTEETDACWEDRESHWPGGARLYTLCFRDGHLVSKTYEDD